MNLEPIAFKLPPAEHVLEQLCKGVNPATGRHEPLNQDLQDLLIRAMWFFEKQSPDFNFVPERGLMKQLDDLARIESNPERKAGLERTITLMRAYFERIDPDDPLSAHGRIRLYLTEDNIVASLFITPPRGDGDMPTISTAMALLEHSGIKRKPDVDAINRALKTVRDNLDVIWGLTVARGEPSTSHRRTIAYRTRLIDKRQFRQDLQRLKPGLMPLGKPVEVGEVIGQITEPVGGRSGIDVFGQPVPPPVVNMVPELPEDVERRPDNTLVAKSSGYVVVDRDRVDIVPFYLMEEPPPGTVNDFNFAGAVVVVGTLKGPGAIECEDLYVIGNCEQMQIVARGDVFVSGAIMGHSHSVIDADGAIYANFISEAKLTILGEVVVSNAIINSTIVSNNRVIVTSPKGVIAGGRICSLMDLRVATIGSEFGMLTETVVGKDFLSTARLAEIVKKIALHEENLRRIQVLKNQLVSLKMPVEQMPPDKQEIYIGVLRKEHNSQAALKSMLRRRHTLVSGLHEFISASVQVLDKLYPPTRIQIGDAIREISEQLEVVTLRYDKDLGIVSDPKIKE